MMPTLPYCQHLSLSIVTLLLLFQGHAVISEDNKEVDPVTPSTGHRYAVMEGVIGDDLGVRMVLTILPGDREARKDVSGWYEYKSMKRPISLWGEGIDDLLILEEGTEGSLGAEPVITGRFEGNLARGEGNEGATFRGTWNSPDGRKQLPVELREQYAPGTAPLDLYYFAGDYTTTRGTVSTVRTRTVVFPQLRGSSEAVERINAFIRSAAASRGSLIPGLTPGGLGVKFVEPIKSPTPEWFDPEKAASLIVVENSMAIPKLEEDELWLGSLHENYYHAEIHAIYNRGGLICLRFAHVELSGSKEGRGENHVTFELSTGRRVKVNELLKDGWGTALLPLLESRAGKEFGMPANSPLSDSLDRGEVFSISEDWFLCPEGLGFSYLPGSLISQASVIIRPVLAWEEIADLLKPDSLLERELNR